MPAIVFQGSAVKALKDILKFKTGTLIISGQSADPTSVAFDAPIGSLYIQATTSNVYRKLDAGSSTNWQLIGNMLGAASSTDNAVARFDGVTGKVIQNSAVTIDDSGNIATSGTVDGRDVSTDGATLDTHLNGGASKHDANEIDYERTDGSKKNIQAASDDLEAATSDLDDAIGALASTPSNYSPANAAIVASHLVALDTAIGNVISTINMLEFQDSVLTAGTLTPPGSPSAGNRYLILGTGLGDWAGQDNKIAEWDGSAWVYTSPSTGMFVSADDESDKLYLYGGASWSVKNFEATTASGFLSKTGFDIQLTNLNSQNVIIGSGSNVATSVNTSSVGDISASTTGGLEIKAGVIVDADISNSAAISQSKLNLSITDAEVNASAAISQSKLNLSITDAEVNASAAIARTKIASGTADHVVINNGSGVLTSEATLAKVRGGSGQDNTNITFPATGTLATLDGTEKLTNKDIDGATASDSSRITLPKASTSTLNALTRKEGTIVYDTTLDEPFFDDGNDLKPFGINSSNPVNYFSDYSCLNPSKVLTYDDTTAVPVDGTGGTVDYISVTSETTTPITGTKSYKLSKSANNAQGEGFAVLTDRILDNTVKNGQPVLVQFKYQTSANYVSGDIKIYVYRVGSNTLEALNGVDGIGSFGNTLNADQTGRGEFSGYVNCSSTDTAIRVLFHVASVSALAYDVVVDNVFMGTASQLVANVIGAKQAFPPTGSLTTNVTYTGFRKQIGDEMEYEVKIAFSGANTQGNIYINLPSEDVIDTAKLVAADAANINLGDVTFFDSGTDYYFGKVRYLNTTQVRLVAMVDDTGGGKYIDAEQADTSANLPFAIANGDQITVKFKVPLVRLNTGNTISSTQANFQNVAARYNTDAGQSIPDAAYTIVNFEDKTFDDFNTVTVGASWKFTAPVKGRYLVNAGIVYNGTFTVSVLASIWKNNALYSLHSEQGGASVAGSQVNDIVELNAGDYIDIRVYQNSGSSQALWTSNGANYVSVYKIPDLTVVGISGAPSEYLSATSAIKTPAASGHWLQMTGNSLTLTPGEWAVDSACYFTNSGASPNYNYTRILLAGANGNDTGTDPAAITSLPGLTVLGIQDVALDYNGGGGGIMTNRSHTTIYIRLTQTQTLYSVPYAQMGTPANARVTSYVQARRLNK